ncbi:MAG: antibiotic biosynthesis monooxygenase [Geodermatophilaceae bacterium]|jgi:quinol monooxygenase YgiN|nr:antibiotic biosynthesis monooxygenase [Geodermatophilaceae bacterium]
MLIITAKMYVDPARRAEFLAGSAEELRQARAEPGCVDFIVAPDPVEPGRVNLFEQWATAEDFAVRCATFTPTPSPVEVLSHEAIKYEISSSGPVVA